MLYAYYLGLDLGQAQDPTAISLVESPVWVPHHFADAWGAPRPGWVSPAEMPIPGLHSALGHAYENTTPPDPTLQVRHLERFELGTRYDKVEERTIEILTSPALKNRPTALLVDRTGVGQGSVDYMRKAGIQPIGISIHAGGKVTRDRDGFRVPKRDLAWAVATLIQTKRLLIAAGMKETAILATELANFQVKINANTGNAVYEHWRDSAHDDLVLATAMAVWFRDFWHKQLERRNWSERRRRDANNGFGSPAA